MNDDAIGKSGIHAPPLAPARILRPGDPGFPADAGTIAGKFRNCEHPGCARRYLPSVPGMRYCLEHNTPEAAKMRSAGMVRSTEPRKHVSTRRKSVDARKAPRACSHQGCPTMFTPKHIDSRFCPEHATSKWRAKRAYQVKHGIVPAAESAPSRRHRRQRPS